MIGQNVHEARTPDQEMIDAATARFLAAGGSVYEAPMGQSGFKPISTFQRPIEPSPATRQRRQKAAAAKKPEIVTTPKERRLSPADVERRARDTKIAEMAKTMSSAEVSEATGINRRTLIDLSRRRGFKFQPCPVRWEIDPAQDARNIERILAMQALGLTRTQCCKRMGISITLIRRLLEVGKIDYPTAGPGRPR